ncbi:hypothetical protein GCM10009802_42830 [Streptomyces synnematoformans]|uniref:Uncharacterized protein n=1 Tax=Streptomyces synnematoformans TaxID=415721 RepID=A0ABN2YZ28_9ACTN
MGSAAPQPPRDPPRMTLRVSRDNGRTFGRQKRYYTHDCDPPQLTHAFPPCQCPRCLPKGGRA